MKEFSVSADLDISANVLFLERDSVTFRCLLAEVCHMDGQVKTCKRSTNQKGRDGEFCGFRRL